LVADVVKVAERAFRPQAQLVFARTELACVDLHILALQD
jgi:hypothetical protein